MSASTINKDRIPLGFFTIKETAAFLSVSDKSVRRLIKRGELRYSKAFRKLIIPIEDLVSFYERTC